MTALDDTENEPDDPRLEGMDERRDLRTLARRIAGYSGLEARTVLALLLLLQESGVKIDPDAPLRIKTEWLRHQQDVKIETLAFLHDVTRKP